MIRDGLGDPFGCQSSCRTGLVGSVIEFFENLLHLNFENQLPRRSQIIIRQLVELGVKQRTQFLGIGGLDGGSAEIHC